MPQTKNIHVHGQLRRWVIKSLEPKTKGERELKAACVKAGREMERQDISSLSSSKIDLTNEALGAALEIGRSWLDRSNGNDVMAAKSILKFELEYEPEDPRQRRHDVKMPKSLTQAVLMYATDDKLKKLGGDTEADLRGINWMTGTGAAGRIRVGALGWLLERSNYLIDMHPTPNVQRAAKRFVEKYTEPYEQTQRLINGYLGTDDDEDQAPEVSPERKPLVVVACGGKKSDAPGKIPAEERYTGNYFRACLMAADVMDGPTMILSAKYGLIPLTEEIENYDVKLGDPGSIRLGDVRRQVEALGLEDAKVTVLGGERYVKAARQIWPDAEAPLKGGIGQQLKQLAEIAGSDVLEDDEHQDQEPVRQWEKKRVSDLVSLTGHRRWFYFGGLAKHPVNENGPLVSLKWSESANGWNYLKDAETGQTVTDVHSMSKIWAIPAEAPEGFVEYEDRDKAAEQSFWPAEWSRGQFRYVPNLPTRGRTHEPVIWFGGKAGVNDAKPKAWQKVKVTYIGDGKYDLSDVETGETVKTCTMNNQIFWATVGEVEEAPRYISCPAPEVEYEVPANFVELAEEANTEAARRYWKRRCDEYRRTGK
ncbi:DUF6884 domain-containing protein [Streptomyces werraensis]|uniref:DUF6884 domain-containing protein n=1 Tax=Streptomyces werraensis TaxID=68284 RepID=UPI0036F70691